MIHYLILGLFVAFMIFLITGFNKKILENNEKRRKKWVY